MVSLVSKTSMSYDKLMGELKLATGLVKNMSSILDKQNVLIANADYRTAVALIKMKNEMVAVNEQSIKTYEDMVLEIGMVKHELKNIVCADKVSTSNDIENNNSSVPNVQAAGFFQSMTLNIADGKFILTLSVEPAPIAFVIFVTILVYAIFFAIFFCCCCFCKHCKNKKQSKKSKSLDDSGYDSVSDHAADTTGTTSVVFVPRPPTPKPISKNRSSKTSSSTLIPPPPPPPLPTSLPSPPPLPSLPSTPEFSRPLVTSTPKNTPKLERAVSFSFADIPKMKPDGTVRRPSEVIDPKKRKKIPNTRPKTKIVNGNIVKVAVSETDL